MLEVKLHDIGEGMTEGEIIHYLVKEGDQVTVDQPLVEVQTDKMVAELPSPGMGTIKEIVIETGVTVPVGTTLIYLEAEGRNQSATPRQPEKKESTPPISDTGNFEREAVPYRSVNRVLATPYTRKIARDHQVNIEEVRPIDPSGRVRDEDVYLFIEGKQKLDEGAKQATEEETESVQPDEIPFRGIRRQIAKNMTKSLFTIPHVTHFDEVDMTRVFELREQLKKEGTSITIAAFLLKALVIALKEYPIFNAELDEENERILLKKAYHIGMATDTKDGLIVPVIHDVDQKPLTTIHEDIKELTYKANSGMLKPADIQGSTFTVSNVGPLGSTGATPIINYPETALIAFHKTKKMPVVNDQDDIVIRQIMTLSMSFDHRVADGGSAVAFTNRFASLMEHPGKLMLEMY